MKACVYCVSIKEIIERVDQRAMACDGPVTPTLLEMNQTEMSAIYQHACRGAGNTTASAQSPDPPRAGARRGARRPRRALRARGSRGASTGS